MTVSNTLLVAMIGFMGVIVSSGAGYLRLMIEKRKLAQAELEMRFQRAALSFPEFVEEWGEISAEIVRLLAETTVDRFLILRAWNGYMEPRWTTCMYQMRSAGQTPIAYVHFELDTDYVSRLREVTAKNNVYLIVDELPHDAVLSEIYRAEGITAAYISHLASYQGPTPSTKAHTYCSFATHSDDKMDEATRTRCKILANRMKGLANSFDEKPI